MKSFIKLSFLLSSVLFFSCETEVDLDELLDDELVALQDVVDSETMSDEDVSLVEFSQNSLISDDSGRKVNELCADVTVDSVNKVVTLDFGEGCTGPFGRSRKGKIFITYGGEFGDNLANRVITFEDYYVGIRQITGSIELADYNYSENGNMTHTRTLNEYTVTFSGGRSRTINGSIVNEVIEGYGDFDISNNVVLVTGGFEATTIRGVDYTYTILEPVKLDFSCFLTNEGMLRVEGVTELTRNNSVRVRTRTVDYGVGCDDQYTVTIDSERIELEG